MRLGNLNIPCGCDSRKEVMFDKGNLGITEVAMLLVAISALTAAYIYSKGRA